MATPKNKKKIVKKKKPTAKKKTFTAEQKVQRSLNDAAKILNKKMHRPDLKYLKELKASNIAASGAATIVLYQVWCESERKVVTTPSTDQHAQQQLSTQHDQLNGHTSKVLSTT